jgi:hypothetical protein
MHLLPNSCALETFTLRPSRILLVPPSINVFLFLCWGSRPLDFDSQQKQQIEELIQSLNRAMEKFIIKEPHVSPPDNQETSSLPGNAKIESENIF